eukprot:TRINITY_DN4503_c0_g1_i1.p1 TRINITY_DN4503_c0_g1~~TRINITY_DN4503_c0_g1_i1.p1  ORF type:complete len:652 (-),score=114.26 TRINITY_DN4503_c0_g1_i1:35-1990(-)
MLPRREQTPLIFDVSREKISGSVKDPDFVREDPSGPGHGRWQIFKQKFPYYIPILFWMPNYQWRRDLPKDLIAGLGVAFMLIPQSLAYSSLAGLPPIIGLYTALIPLFVYTIFGTSKQMSIGPDALGSLLVGVTLAESEKILTEDEKVIVAHALAFVTGLFLFTLGLLRVGFVDNVLSRPLLCGFVNAVACIILCDQLNPLFGILVDPSIGHGWPRALYAFKNIKQTYVPTLLFGIVTIGILVGIQIIKKTFGNRFGFLKYIPQTLVVVILGIVIRYGARNDAHIGRIRILGNISQSFPVPTFPHVIDHDFLTEFVSPSIIIGIIGFVESIVVAKLYSTKHHYSISANRELISLGMTNFIGSFFRIYPTFGSLPRSAVADNMGAQTQLFNSVAGCVILAVVLYFGQFFTYLPNVVMAAIIIVAAVLLLEFEDIIFLWKIRSWTGLLQLAFTFFITFILGPELGIFINICISIFLVIKHTTAPSLSILGKLPDGRYRDISSNPDAEKIPGILIVRIQTPLYFANIAKLKHMLFKIEKLGSATAHPTEANFVKPPETKAVLLHVKYATDVDSSALETLHEMAHAYEHRGIYFGFIKLLPHLVSPFLAAGIVSSQDKLFSSIEKAVDAAEAHVPPAHYQSDASIELKGMDIHYT